MNKLFTFKRALLLAIMLSCFGPIVAQVYLQTETKRLHDSKVVSTKSEILLDVTTGLMQINYSKPDIFSVETNSFGEMTVYFPAKNEVLKQRNMFFSSESDLIYHFFTQNANDLGLKQSGFKLIKSEYENDYLVTIWVQQIKSPIPFEKAKLVQEDYLPIYLEFYNKDEDVVQKTYFTSWKQTDVTVFPTKITQIDFVGESDSIISRKVYSELVTGPAANLKFKKVNIPDNAKLISKE